MYCNTKVKPTRPRVYENILETIGNTPLVRLNVIPKEYGLKCEFYAKCEFLNPGGSIKDRIAYNMIKNAENENKTRRGTRFVEPTSGNTGIGLAFVAAVKNQDPEKEYETIIVTPVKNSEEKINTMRLLGSSIRQLGPDEDELSVAKEIVNQDLDNNIELNQFENQVNPDTHFLGTAQEIWNDMDHKVDMAVMGVGTGGTITGVARFLKQCNDGPCIIIGVDPVGSHIYSPDPKDWKPFYVEGIGGEFVPSVLNKTCVDKVVRTEDACSFNMARELIRKEGLLCGGSSGAAMCAAIKAANEYNLNENHKVVVVLPDGIRNYMTKFVCDQWMEAHLFKNPPARPQFDWWTVPLTEDDWTFLTVEVPIVSTEKSCRDLATNDFSSGHNVAIVVDLQLDVYEGAISKNQLRYSFINPGREKTMNLDDLVSQHMIHDCPKVQRTPHVTMGLISRIMDIAPFVVVLENTDSADDTYKTKGKIITTEKVWDWILKKQNKTKNW